MRIVFAGTPEFAAVILRVLMDRGAWVAGVYTQPDRPAGRGRRTHAGPVKQLAEEHGLRVYQPFSLRDANAGAQLAALQPDLMIVAAYGLILPPPVLVTPRLGCINVYASLLPRWRGAAPIQRALLAGDSATGISIMRMDAGLDTGPVMRQARCVIHADDIAATLHDRLAILGAATLCATLDDLANGNASEVAQRPADATYAARIEKSEASIVWDQPAARIERQVRAFNPWPVTYTRLPGASGGGAGHEANSRLRVWEARVIAQQAAAAPGTVLATGAEGIDVATADETLRLTRVQRAGARVLAARDFLNACRLVVGARLGAPPDTGDHR